MVYIDVYKVKEEINNFGLKKAPGPDGWPPLVLQNLTEELVEYLTEIYKASCKKCVIPKEWREMKVVFISKMGKDDYSSPKAYDPSPCLTSC